MPSRSAYAITIDGRDVTSNFDPVLISLTIKDGDGGKSDTLEIKLDDAEGQIALPRAGAGITARLWSLDDGSAVTFQGKTDEPKSTGSRGSGMELSITAHSADMQGEGKHKTHRHKDGGSFKDAATQFGQKAAFTVTCDADVGAVARAYWAMSHESFYGWGQRMAEELGATFKVRGTKAVFVSRNASAAASGTALGRVTARWGDNLISWDMTPVVGRAQYASAKVRWYDAKAATWMEEDEPIDAENAD